MVAAKMVEVAKADKKASVTLEAAAVVVAMVVAATAVAVDQ